MRDKKKLVAEGLEAEKKKAHADKCALAHALRTRTRLVRDADYAACKRGLRGGYYHRLLAPESARGAGKANG